MLVKFIIFLFPIFGLLSIAQDHWLHLAPIHFFIFYMTAITLLLLVYEVVTCCCFSTKYPAFIFRANDLNRANT